MTLTLLPLKDDRNKILTLIDTIFFFFAAVIIIKKSAMFSLRPPNYFTADHPFLFFLINRNNNCLSLFNGRLYKPLF